MDRRRPALFILTGIKRQMGEGNLDIALVEYLFQAAIKFPGHPPLFDLSLPLPFCQHWACMAKSRKFIVYFVDETHILRDFSLLWSNRA